MFNKGVPWPNKFGQNHRLNLSTLHTMQFSILKAQIHTYLKKNLTSLYLHDYWTLSNTLTTCRTLFHRDFGNTVCNNCIIVYNSMFFGHYILGGSSLYSNFLHYQGREPFMHLFIRLLIIRHVDHTDHSCILLIFIM